MTDDRIAGLDQAVQHREVLDVVEVQARGRIVEDVEGAAGGALGQLPRQLDALRLAPESGRGLAEGDVPGRRRPASQGPPDLGMVLEEKKRIVHRQVEESEIGEPVVT